MFLCEDCHDSNKCPCFSGSYGPCESCGRAANCTDCHARCPIKSRKTKQRKTKAKTKG